LTGFFVSFEEKCADASFGRKKNYYPEPRSRSHPHVQSYTRLYTVNSAHPEHFFRGEPGYFSLFRQGSTSQPTTAIHPSTEPYFRTSYFLSPQSVPARNTIV